MSIADIKFITVNFVLLQICVNQSGDHANFFLLLKFNNHILNFSFLFYSFAGLFQTWPSVRFYLEKTIKSAFFR